MFFELYRHANSTLESRDLFRTGFEIAHNFLRLFWRPKQFIMEKVDRFYDTHFKGFYVIGMQFRFLYLSWNDTQAFFECAKSIELRVNRPTKWFIISDNNTRLLTIEKMFPEKVVHADGNITHVYFNTNGYERALVDIELMSRCDEIIITGGSSFGWSPCLCTCV